jgi:predicted permease
MRSFRRSPAFTLVALLSLTLGIGATCAIFSVIYGVLIAPYPYAKADEIWAPQVRSIDGRSAHGYAVNELARLAALPGFSDVMATSFEPVLLTGEFAPESFGGILLSGNAFNFLGVPPVAGRTIQPTDIRHDGQVEPVVVLSYRLWFRLFDGSPSAIGRTLRLNNTPFTIIGVMPPRFGWYGNAGFWLPLSPTRTDLVGINPIMRLAPGVTKTVAEQQLDVLNRQLARERPSMFPAQGFTTTLLNYLDITVASGEMQTSLRLLLGAVGFLLLIACANVANLQLARGSARAREIAVRISIGAGRGRLLRQLLTESVVLSLAGGALGVLFAFVANRSIVALMPEFYVPNESQVTMNVPVLLFSLAVSLVTGMVFGLAPALKSSREDVGNAFKSGRGTGAEAHGGGLRSVLVVTEVALSVVLLAGAGLTIRTFYVLQSTDPGIKADRVLAVSVPLPALKYATLDQRNRFAQDILDRVAALPGVEAGTFGLPFGGPPSAFTIAGETSDPSKRITVNLAGADHLRVFGIPLRIGRMFDAAEVRRGDRVAVINEAAAKLWPAGANPFGARLRLAVLERPPSRTVADTSRPPEVTIVGVIANTRNAGLRSDPDPVVVMPYSIIAAAQRTLAVRASGDPNLFSIRSARWCATWLRTSRSDARSRSPKSSARTWCNPASRWRCSPRSPRWVSRSRRPVFIACCRSMSRGERTNWGFAARSARHGATCSACCSEWAGGWSLPVLRLAFPRVSPRPGCFAASCTASSRPIRSPTERLPFCSAWSPLSRATSRLAAPRTSIRWWRSVRTDLATASACPCKSPCRRRRRRRCCRATPRHPSSLRRPPPSPGASWRRGRVRLRPDRLRASGLRRPRW